MFCTRATAPSRLPHDIIVGIDINQRHAVANISLRGLDRPTLSRLRSNARRRGISVNRLIVETLQQQYSAGTRTFDDLDALAGTWTKAEADAFAAAIAPFEEIDPGLWAAEPQSAYRVKPAARRKARK
jgi:hypothetical protein